MRLDALILTDVKKYAIKGRSKFYYQNCISQIFNIFVISR